MKKPLIDPFAAKFAKYANEKKAIKKFLKYWGTMTIRAKDGTDHEVLLPSNFVWSEPSRVDVEDYPYELGGNKWPDGTVYRGSAEELADMQAEDHKKYDTQNCVHDDYANSGFLTNPDGTFQTDENGNLIPDTSTTCTTVDGMRGWPKAGTRVRGLLDMLGAWEDIKNNDDIKQTNTAWLFLDPAKGLTLSDSNVKDGINKFFTDYQDKQGRVTVKAKIVLSDRVPIPQYPAVPRSFVGDDNGPAVWDVHVPSNVYTATYRTEDVYLLDADGEIVRRPVYQKNPDGTTKLDKEGKPIPTGATYPVIMQETVPSYDGAYLWLVGSADIIWDRVAIIPEVVNTPRPEGLDDSIESRSALANYGMYEKIVAKTAAVYLDRYAKKTNTDIFGVWSKPEFTANNSGIRVSQVSRGQYSWSETVSRDADVSGSYSPFIGGDVTASYSGINYSGDRYEVRYTVPTLELTMVIRNPAAMVLDPVSPVLDKVLKAAKADYWVVETDYDTYISTPVLKLDALNGYDINKILFSMYGDADNPSMSMSSATYAEGSTNNTWLPSLNIANPDMWVVREDGDWFYGRRAWYYLKKDVLTTDIYIKKRSDRIKFVMGLIDSGYDVDDDSGGLLAGVLMIVIIVVAVYTGGAASGLLAATAATVTVTMIALTIVIAAMIISLATMVVANANPALARQLAAFSKTTAPLVVIAGLYLTITGMYDMYNGISGASSSTSQEVTEQVLAESMKTAGYEGSTWASSNFIKDITSGMFDDLVGAVSNISTRDVISKGMQVADIATKMYYESELKKLENAVNSKQEKLNQQAQALEARGTADWARLAMTMNLNPLTRLEGLDGMERMYESTVSEMHSGTTQPMRVVMMGDGAVTYINNIA